MDEFYAHKREDNTLQTVRAHLEGTARYARKFGKSVGMEEEAVYAAMAHDIGKYTKAFQDRLLNNGKKVDHSTAGMLEAIHAKHMRAAFAIAGHHAGLPDLGAQGDTANDATLWGRRKRKPGEGIEDYSAFRSFVQLEPPAVLPSADELTDYLRTKMLYSCLIDADWLDTEWFMNAGAVERGAGEPIETLVRRFDAWLADKGWTRPASEKPLSINEMRSDILYTCMDHAARSPGLFTLTVPTGGGKTTASLAFALQHALENGLERIIYVIPYTSIIDQTAAIFRTILGDENILEHHSQVKFDPEDDRLTPAQKKLQLATENWDAPVIVTTSVQFFESLFANRKSPSRKIHNIAKSVVIFDEAQLLPVPFLKPCVAAIARLARDFGVSAVLCTATQPALNELIREYTDAEVRELAPDPVRLNAAFRRTTIRMVGAMDDDALADELNAHDQALCVVNSKRHAQTLFQKLKTEGAYQLSTLLYPAHRQRKLNHLRMRLKEGRPCRVVSTSLIEAGVDVDFPAVYRALSGLDSILQAAGRCNREGQRGRDESIVTVFEPELPSPQIFMPNIEAARGAMRIYEDAASLEAIREYFAILYANKGERLDDKNILPLIRQFAFSTIGDIFKIINENTRSISVLFREEEAQALERRLRNGERSRALLRALGRYSVSVNDNHYRALVAAGALERMDEDIYLLRSIDAYDENLGLTLEPEGGSGYHM
ncbi:MAG: CRISPR-associated helicase Cas3' [Christensenellales bacterium]|jgi:CRISPR-associated endonuclease/helicase Cas3